MASHGVIQHPFNRDTSTHQTLYLFQRFIVWGRVQHDELYHNDVDFCHVVVYRARIRLDADGCIKQQ
jgi:hypothetical protein